jgi:aspartate/methionine/tyrosine aminotransferase
VLAQTRPVVEREAARLVAEGLLQDPPPPYGCMWFPRVPGVSDTRSLSRRLLAEFDVVVAPGEFFGAPGAIRIGFGADAASVETGLQRLGRGLAALRA